MVTKMSGFGPSTPALYLSDDDYRRFEVAGDVKLNECQRAELLHAIDVYRTALNSWRQGVRPGEVRRFLAKLQKQTDTLHATLHELEMRASRPAAAAQWQLSWEYSAHMRRLAPGIHTSIGWLETQLFHLALVAETACKELPNDGLGREPDPYRAGFIRKVYRIFKNAGGYGKITYNAFNECYEGAFCRFARVAFSYAPDAKRRGDIGKLIQEALAEDGGKPAR